jgi:transcription elongation GreA/GreB family factor
MLLKEKIYQACTQMMQEKISHLQQILKELHYSAANETKSTAGDKHETALAMLQIEQENKRKQLKELQMQQVVLDKIDPNHISVEILNGALVKTDKGYFFISVALGKVEVGALGVYALSATSPLGAKMRGKQAGNSVEVNGTKYQILSVE